MTVRPLRATDIPILQGFHRAQGFDYPFPDLCGPLIEAVLVVVDDEDRPVMAAVAEKLVQISLIAGVFDAPPTEKLYGIRILHQAMSAELRTKEYNIASAFLPPEIAEQFGRRLMKTFGWFRSPWKCFGFRF